MNTLLLLSCFYWLTGCRLKIRSLHPSVLTKSVIRMISISSEVSTFTLSLFSAQNGALDNIFIDPHNCSSCHGLRSNFQLLSPTPYQWQNSPKCPLCHKWSWLGKIYVSSFLSLVCYKNLRKMLHWQFIDEFLDPGVAPEPLGPSHCYGSLVETDLLG